MKNKEKLSWHSFTPGAMSIIQMGEELMGHPSTAINELVKNGYDADALTCYVYFHYSRNHQNTFAVIFDDGSGMDEKILFGDWLKPSISSKRKTNARSKVYKRSMLGRKGIGRLSAMALGELVTIVTRKDKKKKFNWITVNREKFKEDILLDQVRFPGNQMDDFFSIFTDEYILENRNSFENTELIDFLKKEIDCFPKGTLIVIENLDESVLKILRRDFAQSEFELPLSEPYQQTEFYRALATLITPLDFNTSIQYELHKKGLIDAPVVEENAKNNFVIKYGVNLLPDQEEHEWLNVESIPIQTVYDYRVYGKVSARGDIKGLLSYRRLDKDVREENFEYLSGDDDGELTNIQRELFEREELEEKEDTGEYYFDIRVYDIGEKDNLEKLARQAKLENGAKFREVFKTFQGLRVSKNGFGVKPYGEEVEDWIGLSKARVQNPGRNVNTNQILGYVFFYSPQNDNLDERTNREGFRENKAFQQVKDTLRLIFSNLGKKRFNYRLKHGLGRHIPIPSDQFNIQEYIARLKEYGASDEIIDYSEGYMKDVSSQLDDMEEILSFSERLASLGTGVKLIYHEMVQPVSLIRGTASLLDSKKNKIPTDILPSFLKDLDELNIATEALVGLRKSLIPAMGQNRKKEFILYNTFLKVCCLYKSEIEKIGINIIVDDRLKKFEILDSEYAFWISFLNIVNNAVYWLKKSEEQKEIRFYEENGAFVLGNTGPFINEEIIDYIFEYGVSMKSEKDATGLGLALTRSVLNRHNWNIFAENRDDGPAFVIKKKIKN